MSLKPANKETIFDVVIIGGGFSGLAVLANIVRQAPARLKICVIADGGFESFGPAYSTPHMEHLLNVRAGQMGLYADQIDDFQIWSQCPATEFRPRKSYGAYLHHILDTVTAQQDVDMVKTLAMDIERKGDLLHIATDHGDIKTRQCVIAAGNRLIATGAQKRLIENPWNFDFASLKDSQKPVALIGSGLTALDTIVSLYTAGYKGKITCISGNGHLPLPHPDIFEPSKVMTADPAQFKNLRLSTLLQAIRRHARDNWSYAIDSLRPYTADIWKTLSTADQLRFIKRYLWLWNMHRHRFDPQLMEIVQKMKDSGQLSLKKGKVTATHDVGPVITLDIKSPYVSIEGQAFDLAFKCIGPSYRVADLPLAQKLIARNMARAHDNGCGLIVDDDYKLSDGIYALGPLLFGQHLESVAVPDLRRQAAAVATAILKS